jgi:hypothetical protein
MEDILLNLRRELTFSAGGKISKGELTIPRIVFLADKAQWCCHWRISFIKPEPTQCIRGEDPLQALTRTLQAVSALLQNSGIPDLKVWWKTEGDNGGLPVMPL